MAEEEIKSVLSKHYILRISWQFSCLDKEPCLGRGGFLENIYNAYNEKKPIFAATNSYRNLGFVYDTIHAVCEMVDGKIPYGLYNVASESYLNVYEMAKKASHTLGYEDTSFIIPTKDEMPYNLCADPEALKRVGCKMPDFEESLYNWRNMFKIL